MEYIACDKPWRSFTMLFITTIRKPLNNCTLTNSVASTNHLMEYLACDKPWRSITMLFATTIRYQYHEYLDQSMASINHFCAQRRTPKVQSFNTLTNLVASKNHLMEYLACDKPWRSFTMLFATNHQIPIPWIPWPHQWSQSIISAHRDRHKGPIIWRST